MKLVSILLPVLMIGSIAFAQEGGAPAETPAPAHKTAKEAKKACKEQAAGDKKAFKKCMKDWKKSQGK